MEKEVNTLQIQNLLNQVYSSQKHFNEIAKVTGENFNVFSIMSMERNEVYTHSAILCELLDPNGSHGQGDIFLNIFIDIINKKIDINKNNSIPVLNNCSAHKEFFVGEINRDTTFGGRIDIYVTNKKHSLIIENKIDAGSQPNQLLRYYNYAKQNYNDDFWLIYLQKTEENHYEDDLNYTTGFGNELLKDIPLKIKDRVIKITYQHEILEFLNLCLKETVHLPIIRETLNQYIFLIKKITNQSTNIIMSESLIKLITSSPGNIESAMQISENMTAIKNELVKRLLSNIDKITSVYGLILDYDNNLSKRPSYFFFYKENWKYCICFQFYTNDFKDINFGICLRKDNIPENQDPIFNEKIRAVLPIMNSNSFWAGWEHYSEWDRIPWRDLATDKASEIISNKIIGTYNVIKDIPGI